MNYIKTIIALVTAISQILTPVWASMFKGEDSFFEDWSPEQTFTEEYAIELEKTPGKDFVVLNFTDVQLEKWEAYGTKNGDIATRTMQKLIEDIKPDLITLTGDNGWCTSAYLKLIEDIDGYGIPWAPVMGNHDGSCCISEFWCAYKLYEAENCIFKFGPKNMGYGNYVINVTENGHIVHTIFMMDTHSDIKEDNVNGVKESGYDHLWANQLEWYKWVVNGVKRIEGRMVLSSVFFHIPCVEYKEAWNKAYDSDADKYNALYSLTSFGKNEEGVCCPPVNNGFFDLCKELGSTKDIISGHDHNNCSSILYEGIRLTYGMHTGYGGYGIREMSGGTKLSINDLGIMSTKQIYIDPETV